jgi:glycosyltransferase involved in cell wall biosynthesis
VVPRIEYVPDDDVEVYFKAADVLVLPYTHVFQSGVLFLGYNFGLPAIVSDVGSLRHDVEEGSTGMVCRPGDPDDLAGAIDRYFRSDMYASLESRRPTIHRLMSERHSWDAVGAATRRVYELLLGSLDHASERRDA